MANDQQVRLLAAALYEIRLLLGPTASDVELMTPEREAGALAYALHNEALAVIEGRSYDEEAAWRRLERTDQRLGTETCRRLRFHLAAPGE